MSTRQPFYHRVSVTFQATGPVLEQWVLAMLKRALPTPVLRDSIAIEEFDEPYCDEEPEKEEISDSEAQE